MLLSRLPICNGKPERAPHILGRCFILCWRCTSVIIFAIITTTIVYSFEKNKFLNINLAILAVLSLFPMMIDGTLQYLFKRESTNLRRIITGSLFGIGLTILLFQISILLNWA